MALAVISVEDPNAGGAVGEQQSEVLLKGLLSLGNGSGRMQLTIVSKCACASCDAGSGMRCIVPVWL